MKVEQDPITYYKRGIILNQKSTDHKFPEKHLCDIYRYGKRLESRNGWILEDFQNFTVKNFSKIDKTLRIKTRTE